MPLGSALAGLVASLLVLGVACLTAPPAPTPEVPFIPEDRPSPAARGETPTGRRERVRVSGAGTQAVNLRAEPGMSATRLRGLVERVELELVGPDRTADGMTWRHVRDPADGAEGWVSADFLAPVAGSPAASPSERPR